MIMMLRTKFLKKGLGIDYWGFAASFDTYVNTVGVSNAALTILDNEALKREIIQNIFRIMSKHAVQK